MSTAVYKSWIAKTHMRFDWLSASLIAIYFAVFKLVCIPKAAQQGLKVCCVYFVLLFLLTNLKGKDFVHPSLPFCGLVLVSSISGYLSGYIDASNCADALFYGICLYALALLVSTCRKRGRMGTLVNVFLLMTLVYCVMSVIFIIKVGVADGPLLYYFAGNKFSTSYYFLLLGALVYARLSLSKKKATTVGIVTAAVFAIALFVSRHVFCSTAAVMSAVAILLLFVPPSLKRMLSRPLVVIALMLVTGAVLAVLYWLLEIPSIQYLVVDVLGENMTLTGRDLIYNGLGAVISQAPIVGHGYGNAAVAMYVGYGNAQNSIMETLVNYGCFGLGTIFYLVWQSLRRCETDWCWGMFILLYAMVVGSIVEITYNYYFFISLYLIGSSFTNQEPEETVSCDIEGNCWASRSRLDY